MKLKLPYVSIYTDELKVAPFKYSKQEPYGPFANTTEPGLYPIKQQVEIHGTKQWFNWLSSEHAFHAQKIIWLAKKLPPDHPCQPLLAQMLKDIEETNKVFLPRDEYDPLINAYLPKLEANGLFQTLDKDGDYPKDKQTFDKFCDSDYHVLYHADAAQKTFDFMRIVMRLKLEQYPELAQIAIACAKEGIIPVEVSRYDDNWASGEDGDGLNRLGLILLEIGNDLLLAQGGKPAILDPWQRYKDFRKTYSYKVLGHEHLDSLLKDIQNWEEVVVDIEPEKEFIPEPDYHFSRGSNQRLVILEGKVVGYQYRNAPEEPWQDSTTPAKFKELEKSYYKENQQVEPKLSFLDSVKTFFTKAGADKGNPRDPSSGIKLK